MLDSQHSAAHALRGSVLGGPSLGTCGMEPLGGDMLETQGGAWVPLTLRVIPSFQRPRRGSRGLGRENLPPPTCERGWGHLPGALATPTSESAASWAGTEVMRPLGPSLRDPKGQGIPGCKPPGLACREGAGGEEGEHRPPCRDPGR